MRRGRGAIVIVAVLLSALPAHAQTPSLSPEAFADRLRRAEEIATDAASNPSAAEMDRVRAAVGLPVVVVFADGDRVRIDGDPFLYTLRGRSPAEFNAAAAHLNALRGAVGRAAGTQPPDEARFLGALAESYRGVRATYGWRERLVRAVIDAIQSFLARLGSFSGLGSVFAWSVVLAVLALAVWLAWRLRIVPDPSVRTAGVAKEEAVDWHRLAREALARGDEPEAVRAHFRALLAALAARGIVPDTPSLTAGECRLSVGRFRPRVYQEVAHATTVFERVAYGGLALAPGDLEAMEHAERVARAA